MIAWRIYYDDGSSFDSSMGSEEDAPSYGILCIVYPNEDFGRIVMSGWDWYFYHDEEKNWWGADIHGLCDQLCHNKPVRAVKQGRNAPDKIWKATIATATSDPDFPAKNAKSRRDKPTPAGGIA